MATSPFPYITPEQYLEIEREAPFRSEYIGGVMYPHNIEHRIPGEQSMAGGLLRHAQLAAALLTSLSNQLRGKGCQVFPSDLKVGVSQNGPFYYPDVSVVCGPPRTLHDRDEVLLNPILIIELISKSSQSFDRGAKFEQYKRIDSLQNYVLVSQSEARIEVFSRTGDLWQITEFSGASATCHLSAIACEIPLSELYDPDATAPR